MPIHSFAGRRVAAFESRMAGPMADLIAKHGGVPIIAPALREIPIEDNPAALDFARVLFEGRFDIVIFLTGVGARFLAQAIETRYPRAEWISALERAIVVVRGPKPLAALRELNARVDISVPEPNTWHEVLGRLDEEVALEGKRVAVQEYGAPNDELVEALRSRGAEVATVPVYRWALPEDTGPLRATLDAIRRGEIDVALFTSAQQVVNVLLIATELGIEEPVLRAFATRVVVGSVGPTTTEMLRARGLPVDIEPAHPKMGHLVSTAAAEWAKTAKVPAPADDDEGPETVTIAPIAEAAARADAAERLRQSRFLRACRREPTDTTPIWLMRQAGRYMPEYRALRAKVPFLDLCKRPELAAEVTVTAAERLGVDAAILFADILLILEPLGFALEFSKGEGPVIHNPVRVGTDVDRVRPLDDVGALGFVAEAVRQIRAALSPDVPLIGFAGAPFTLACYAIEGGGSRQYDRAKAFMYTDPGAWDVLLRRLVDATAAYLRSQVEAGAQALQLFDSWVGTLGPDDYHRFVQPHMQRLFAALPADVPAIHFGTGTATLLELQRDAGGSVIGLDWRVDLREAWDRLGPGVAVQGNMDPAALLGPRAEVEARAQRILDRAQGQPGHVFNLGHGILPNTPVEHALALVDYVHRAGGRS